MWIIFDLDDTLIQTTDVTTPFYLRKVADLMGGSNSEKNKIFIDLLAKHQKSVSSRETLNKFFAKNPEKKKFCTLSHRILYEQFPQDTPIQAYPEVNKILSYLSRSNTLFIVSKGIPSIQMKKLKKAGIDCKLFSKIVVSSKEDKRESYQKIVRMGAKKKASILVVGDRPVLDLKPAKELGCITVHIRRGRGKEQKSSFHNFSIDHLDQLIGIVNKERGNHGIE